MHKQGDYQPGNYRIIRGIGKGNFGYVYLAEHVILGTPAAIKVLRTNLTERERNNFLVEARTAADLGLIHPHIIGILDFGIEDGLAFLVMTYASNGSLHRHYHKPMQQLTLPLVVTYVTQAADALQYVHDHNLIHCDVKPGNILLDANQSIRLTDFGCAIRADGIHNGQARNGVGTVGYMPPEQLRGYPHKTSDEYALAVIACELLIGDNLFHGSHDELIKQHLHMPIPSLRRRRPDLPVAVEQVLMRALAKHPEDRYPDIADFAAELDQASKQPSVKRSSSSLAGRSPHREVGRHSNKPSLGGVRRQQLQPGRRPPMSNPVQVQTHPHSEGLSPYMDILRPRRRPTFSQMPITDPHGEVESRQGFEVRPSRRVDLRQGVHQANVDQQALAREARNASRNLGARLIAVNLSVFVLVEILLFILHFALEAGSFLLGVGLLFSSVLGTIQLRRFSPLFLLMIILAILLIIGSVIRL